MSKGTRVRIGLEVHVQITSLRTKLFCSCPSNYRGKPPNSNVCPVCLGLPGALPVVNREAIREALKVALALNSKINRLLIFTRKHYFYPDLPKNYQISQYDGVGSLPIAKGGFIRIENDSLSKIVRIRRINIEEDPGRITYPTGSMATSPYTLIDYNRSGVALLEIVTEPDLESPKEARIFISKLVSILEHLGVTNPELEGAVRVDANISIEGGERVEIKNIGSPKDVEKALQYEIARQSAIVKSGGSVNRETRHWDKGKGITVSSRAKELEEDYRYFPDPDLPPIPISSDLIDEVRSTLPELPDDRIKRLMSEYGLSKYLAHVVVIRSKLLADAFESAVRACGNASTIASILVNELLRWVDECGITIEEGLKLLTTERICKLVRYLKEKKLSSKLIKEYIKKIITEDIDPDDLIGKGYVSIMDPEYLSNVIEEVFKENPKAVEDARRNPKAINYLVGQVMKKTMGKADPQLTYELINRRLKENVH